MTTLEDVTKGLSPKMQKLVRVASEVELERMPLASYSLTKALGGGVGYGRQCLVWGQKSAGKTSLLLASAAKAQKQGKTVALIDAENSFEKQWAESLGVDTKNLLLSTVKSIDDMGDISIELINSGIDVIIVDSISSLLSSAFFEKKGGEMKELQDTKQIGSEAKDLASALKAMNYANKNTALLLVSQIRMKMGQSFAYAAPTGGEATKFFSSTIIRLSAPVQEDKQVHQDIAIDDRILKKAVGRPVSWEIEYNKIGPPSSVGQYDFYYLGDNVGVDYYGEIVREAESFGVIKKAGSWLKYGDVSIQGYPSWSRRLKEDKDLLDEIVKQL